MPKGKKNRAPIPKDLTVFLGKAVSTKKTRVLTEGKRDRSLVSRTGQGEAVKSMMIPSPKETRERGPELEMGKWWR